LPENFIQKDIAFVFVDTVEDRDVKRQFFTDDERSFNKSLNQALKLKAAKVAAGLSAKLGKVSLAPQDWATRMLAVWRRQSAQKEVRRDERTDHMLIESPRNSWERS
jgi:hypothetical protein